LTDMDETIEKINLLNHKIMRKLRMDNMGRWSKDLLDLSYIELTIIRLLFEKPFIIMKEVGKRVAVPGSTLTSIIDRLENVGIVERMPSKKDRRAIELRLTPKGEHVHSEHERVDRLITKKMLKPLSKEEVESLMRLLEKIFEG